MGQTLSSAAQWTSAHEGGHGKLEFSSVNEFILKEIARFVEELAALKNDESTFVFKRPLSWMTGLDDSDFTLNYHAEGPDVVSDAVDGSGRPTLVLRPKGSSMEVSVSSFEQLGFLAEAAGSAKLLETRHCLEANRDPVATILGDRFTTAGSDDVAVYRLTEEIASLNQNLDSNEGASVAIKKTMLALLLRLKSLDSRLMRESIKLISAEIKLSPEEVDRAFDNLKTFSGSSSEDHVLKEIMWLQPYTFVFKNGCRAPFWRQLNGDISYIVATPHDGKPIFITASTHGYFVNGGLREKTIDLDFEKKGDYYKDLMTLLRHKSPQFNKNIEKQDIFKAEEKLLRSVGSGVLRGQSATSFHGQPSGTKVSGVVALATGDRVSSPPPSVPEKLKKILTGEELKKEGGKPVKRTTRKKDGDQTEKKHVKIDTTQADKQKKMLGKNRYSADSTSGSEDENNEADKCTDKFEPPPDYWLIQKYMKFIRGGNQVATLIALCSLTDLNLSLDSIQLAIRDLGGIELLINIVETKDIRCQIGALRILNEVSQNCAIRQFLADLGAIQILVKLIRGENNELRCLAAETIAHVAQFKRARRIVRTNDGITSLVALLDLNANKNLTKSELAAEAEAARCAAMALWSCCKSRSNKMEMRQAGVVPLLSQLLWSTDTRTLIPVVGILHECASEAIYVVSIRTEGMLGNFIKLLNQESVELQTECASALFVCAAEKDTCDVIRQLSGLRPLVNIISTAKDKKLLAAAAGAIWKCSFNNDNCMQLYKLQAIEHLTKLLDDQPEEVLINVVGALAEMAKYKDCSQEIRKVNGLTLLVSLLKKTNPALLVNVAKAVGYCAEDAENIVIINRLDGVALIWSLLKNHSEDVQASAARALCPCIENSKDSGEMVRSFIGGLEFVVRLLKSNNANVLASACSVVASIANDEENLAVLTDHGVVPMLAHLTCAESERQRHHLAEAIGRCCKWADNRTQFGKEDAVRPLVGFLKTTNEEVLCSCSKALHELSKDPDNCITMHDVGVIKRMLELVASRNPVIQMSAAGCVSNIRRLALANENYHYQN